MGKPPYRIPSMREIADVPANGLTAVSTFSGAGGGSLGLRWAGYRIAWASEFIPEAREVYQANFPNTPVDDRDIREVDGQDLLDAAGGSIDLLEGSPPCSDFSPAGRLNAGWGKEKKYSTTTQRVDDLFFEFVRLVDETRPRVFIAENTSGLARGVSKGYLKEIHAAMSNVGYRVGAKILDAAYLGVPQHRRRLIFCGVREDLDFDPPYPKPLPYTYSIRDAVPWVDRVESGHGAAFTKPGEVAYSVSKPSPTILATAPHQLMVDGRVPESFVELPPEERGVSIEGYAIEDEWKRLRPGGSSEKYFSLVRVDPSKPSPTITQLAGANPGVAGVTHPFEPRKFSIPELRRLCGFPDDFELFGAFGTRWERLGRAVPPPMYKAMGEAIAKELT